MKKKRNPLAKSFLENVCERVFEWVASLWNCRVFFLFFFQGNPLEGSEGDTTYKNRIVAPKNEWQRSSLI